MNNVLKIIVSDIKRLSTNVVAMVVIMGLTVIPCLYAWFNILSNWDPYGPDATSNLQVAVASSDEGILIGEKEVNVGDIIISNLKENDSIGWVFTDVEQDAIDGVYSGDYYAAIVIDQEFTSDMISFLSGEIENPQIIYYENEKKNAIAPKITGKVKTTIEREVDEAFVSTIAQYALGAGEYIVKADEEGNITGSGIEYLEQLDKDLNGVIVLLNSYVAVMNTTESISEAGEAISASTKDITNILKKSAEEAKEDVEESKVKETKNKVEAKINDTLESLDSISSMINQSIDKVDQIDFAKYNVTEDVKKVTDVVMKLWGDTEESTSLSYFLMNSDYCSADTKEAAKNLDESLKKLNTDVTDLAAAEAAGDADLNKYKEVINGDLKECQTSVDDLRKDVEKTAIITANSSISSTEAAITEIEKLLKYDATSLDEIKGSLENYSNTLGQSAGSLEKSRDEAVEMERKLATLIREIKSLNENEKYQKLIELVNNDPEALSEFLSSPVELDQEYVYPVENNGSAAAPFYIVLSIWVGALIMSTILKTTIKDAEKYNNLKNWQCFFGRFFTTFAIGQIQTMITVLGAFLFVGIQCEHYFLFWLACAWTSFVYSLLLYSFTYSFGNVGEALSVVLMVIQVAGAGGTFPIEVLPKVFQILYKFVPFNYSMNALRECVGGMYGNTYRNCMLTLIVYVAIAVFIGVILYHPSKVLNEMIDESKEKAGILL